MEFWNFMLGIFCPFIPITDKYNNIGTELVFVVSMFKVLKFYDN